MVDMVIQWRGKRAWRSDLTAEIRARTSVIVFCFRLYACVYCNLLYIYVCSYVFLPPSCLCCNVDAFDDDSADPAVRRRFHDALAIQVCEYIIYVYICACMNICIYAAYCIYTYIYALMFACLHVCLSFFALFSSYVMVLWMTLRVCRWKACFYPWSTIWSCFSLLLLDTRHPRVILHCSYPSSARSSWTDREKRICAQKEFWGWFLK